MPGIFGTGTELSTGASDLPLTRLRQRGIHTTPRAFARDFPEPQLRCSPLGQVTARVGGQDY